MPQRNDTNTSGEPIFERVTDFSGGQMYANDIGMIGSPNTSYNLNMDFDGIRGLETRRGISDTEISITGTPVCISAYWDSSAPQIIGVDTDSVWAYNGTTKSTLTGYAPNTSNGVWMQQAGNKLYSVDGVNELYIYDGTNWAANTSPDTNPAPVGCSLISQISGRLVLSKGLRLFWSNIHLNNKPEFDQTNFSIDNGNDGKDNTALCAWTANNLIVWKKSSTVVISCDPVATMASQYIRDEISTTVGCSAPKTAKQVGANVFFLADDGVRMVKNKSSDLGFEVSLPISDPVKDIISRINRAAIKSAHAIYRNNKYILWLPLDGSLTCNYAIVWDERMNNKAGGWLGLWSGWNSVDMKIADVDGFEKLFILTSDNKLSVWNDYIVSSMEGDSDYLDNSDKFISSVDTGGFLLQEPFNQKRWLQAETLYRLAHTNLNGSIYVGLSGTDYYKIGDLEPKQNLSLPLSLPFSLPDNKSRRKTLSLISVDEGNYVSLRVETTNGGKLQLSELWVCGMLKGLRKGN